LIPRPRSVSVRQPWRGRPVRSPSRPRVPSRVASPRDPPRPRQAQREHRNSGEGSRHTVCHGEPPHRPRLPPRKDSSF